MVSGEQEAAQVTTLLAQTVSSAGKGGDEIVGMDRLLSELRAAKAQPLAVSSTTDYTAAREYSSQETLHNKCYNNCDLVLELPVLTELRALRASVPQLISCSYPNFKHLILVLK